MNYLTSVSLIEGLVTAIVGRFQRILGIKFSTDRVNNVAVSTLPQTQRAARAGRGRRHRCHGEGGGAAGGRGRDRRRRPRARTRAVACGRRREDFTRASFLRGG